jgi:SAM-dependent methyltransferase
MPLPLPRRRAGRRGRPGRRRRAPASTRLHIGAFDVVHEGWLNTDVTPHLAIARVPGLAAVLRRAGRLSDERWAAHRDGTFRRLHYVDLTQPLPYPDAAFEAVFGSHVLEHLTPAEAEATLRETHRVLRPGGVVRIAVPDLDRVIAEYDPQAPDDFLFGMWQGRERSTSRHRHWWLYNERSLGELLALTGFAEVQRCAYRQGRCPDVERIDSRPESLFMEGVRQ